MFMGESDSTETLPSKPVCDWMIGLREQRRQAENPPMWKSIPKACIVGVCRRSSGFPRLCKSAENCLSRASLPAPLACKLRSLFVGQMQRHDRVVSTPRAKTPAQNVTHHQSGDQADQQKNARQLEDTEHHLHRVLRG